MKKILELKDLTDYIVGNCFKAQDDFKNEQKLVFQEILNIEYKSDEMAYLLALFLDQIMRKPALQQKNI